LGPYGVCQVLGSSWTAQLDALNQASIPNAALPAKRHFIITFHEQATARYRSRSRAVTDMGGTVTEPLIWGGLQI
jgi:hypothetical protein